ncbi:hypothetical protein DU19_0221 [Chlamydia muridarum]|nr:hypothetical protein [Chlamydia muridarum]KDU80541.1 hypothetical protein DU17_0221 [Chlamydia muridarum]KDU81192.1 hypothetical protein DU18_0222 [Chlamydia muridarum]KDU82170.1 hypothetical protein DU19_0221 [Chlamydia muridarum]KDU83144.1 hypothetical protein DU20_0221 [Chlamydia muridarum]KDU84098.1 hypothetical protein DU21_0221 [Chlamydia muridarum]
MWRTNPPVLSQCSLGSRSAKIIALLNPGDPQASLSGRVAICSL